MNQKVDAMKTRKIAIGTAGFLAAAAVLFFLFLWFANYHPGDAESEVVMCSRQAPLLKPGQKVKVLSWNVQYMAGKNYVFYYDVPDGSGPDERPSGKDIAATIKEVARVIRDENPDVVLLQEVDDGARRTDYDDQLKLLLSRLPDDYVCHASAFYWKSFFVPHPRIMGAVGMKLSVISKYTIRDSVRHRLPQMPDNFIVRQFSLKRAVQEVRLPVENRKEFLILNTHLDAFAQGTDTMERQVAAVKSLLEKFTDDGYSWMIGGDFNLLPPGKAYGLLGRQQKGYYQEKTQIKSLFDQYRAVPGLDEANGLEQEKWFTHFSNDPEVIEPDRTIDYIFISKDIKLADHYVRQHDTLKISDHMPVAAEIELP